jgi:hypothetical protein
MENPIPTFSVPAARRLPAGSCILVNSACTVLAHRDAGQALEFTFAIGDNADVDGRAPLAATDAFDPNRTFATSKTVKPKHKSVPYSSSKKSVVSQFEIDALAGWGRSAYHEATKPGGRGPYQKRAA